MKTILDRSSTLQPVRGARRTICKVRASDSSADVPSTSASPIKAASRPLITRRQLMTGAAATVITFNGCPCPLCKPGEAKASGWSYGDVAGPPAWKGVCSTGKRQSPINIPLNSAAPRVEAELGEFDFAYGSFEKCDVLNTGHGTMQVNFPPGNMSFIGDMELELLQFHFHAPSEHAMDGRRFAMEAHLVHKNKSTGNLAVLGIMLEPGGLIKNPALQTALEVAPEVPLAKKASPKGINPVMLLPKKTKGGARPYVHYPGSLTTPPCSEGVDWFVFMNPIKVPDSQIIDFMHFVGDNKTYATNTRPLQLMNSRLVEYEL
ncbi:Carbonic anhydrase [Tetrabaena socialis]|uniref:Carbonic anhydrase n=1 Tax=Tetrabaena socialis TaxID=47790 RepID=A0A2J7ZPK8_9CHLO|nr:Carbonic anhydrase [Tetrabaena socialis]|eukprot:PNH02191.1 Carbonic anhydrase [Tetrabaena socialis]